jgi:hypothetical protein
MQRLIQLNPFTSVAAGQRAIGNFGSNLRGNVIEQVLLTLGGTFTKSQIDELKVRANGKDIWNLPGGDLDLIERYINSQNNATKLAIDFTEITSRSLNGQFLGALDTSVVTEGKPIDDITIEAKINGAAVNPTLVAEAVVRAPFTDPASGIDPRTRPLIRCLIPTTVPVTVATPSSGLEYPINFGSKGDSLIKRLFIFHANLTAFGVRRNSFDVWENVAIPTNSYLQARLARFPQAGLYVFDPLMDNNQSDSVRTRNLADNTPANFQFKFFTSAPDTLRIYADVYTTLSAF